MLYLFIALQVSQQKTPAQSEGKQTNKILFFKGIEFILNSQGIKFMYIEFTRY